MTVTWLTQGEKALLEGTWSPVTTSTARLFAVDIYSSVDTATLKALDETDFTEPSWMGYAAVALSAPSPGGGGPSTSTNPEISFTCTAAPSSPQRVHGWWLVRDPDGLAICFEVLPGGPFLFSAAGDSLAFQPTLSLD